MSGLGTVQLGGFCARRKDSPENQKQTSEKERLPWALIPRGPEEKVEQSRVGIRRRRGRWREGRRQDRKWAGVNKVWGRGAEKKAHFMSFLLPSPGSQGHGGDRRDGDF